MRYFSFFFKQKTAYEMRISDWSSDVCSSDLDGRSARIDQLMLELARGVHRVGIDHRHAGAQHAEDGDRILQQIWHHQGDAVALFQLEIVDQPGGELAADRKSVV